MSRRAEARRRCQLRRLVSVRNLVVLSADDEAQYDELCGRELELLDMCRGCSRESRGDSVGNLTLARA